MKAPNPRLSSSDAIEEQLEGCDLRPCRAVDNLLEEEGGGDQPVVGDLVEAAEEQLAREDFWILGHDKVHLVQKTLLGARYSHIVDVVGAAVQHERNLSL